MELNQQSLGRYFKLLADQRNARQSAIASSMGVDRSLISKLFTGAVRAPSSYERLAEHFGVTMEDAVERAKALDDMLGVAAEPERAGAYVLAIANEKGGVGKTTFAVNVSAALAELGERVLLVDMDSQGSATEYLDVPADGVMLTEALRGLRAGEDLEPVETAHGFDLLPGGRALAVAVADLLVSGTGFTRLRELLEPMRASYDVVVLDTPPAAGVMQQTALGAADGVLAPMVLNAFALDGLVALQTTVDQLSPHNPELEYLGCVIANLDVRKVSQRQIKLDLERHDDAMLWDVAIRTDARVEESALERMPVGAWSKSTKAAMDYRRVAKRIASEVLGHG